MRKKILKILAGSLVFLLIYVGVVSAAETEQILILGEEQEAKEQEQEQTTGQLTVCIDPGHQGSWVDMTDKEPIGPGSSELKTKSSTGTQGTYSGVAEYQLNLTISLLLRTELESRGYAVVLTREDNDTAISNAERATLAYESGSDIYVRILANGSESSSSNGALGMVPSSSNPYVADLAEDSYLLASCILSAYCEKAGFASLGVQYYDNMTGINWSKIPVMILEMGFMTNESDDLRMQDAAVQALMVEGIADGIDAYFAAKGLSTDTATADAADTDTSEATTDGTATDTATADAIAADTADDTGADTTATEEAQESLYVILDTVTEQLESACAAGESWSLALTDLSTGVAVDYNGSVLMKSASIIKVFVMAAVYDRVLYPSSQERRIAADEEEVRSLLESMITVSSNDAANTLIRLLGGGEKEAGISVVNLFLEENTYDGTVLGRLFLEENPTGDNYTTANDCAKLLSEIYNGTCVCEEASAEMRAYLQAQTRVNKIAAGLSGTTAQVANKTGELAGDYGDYVENDIAIVQDGDTAYVLCILSGAVRSNSEAISRIVDITQQIHSLF